MKEYQEALNLIYIDGVLKNNRTGIETLSYFGLQMDFDLVESFPAITTKKLAWKSVVGELLWILEGSTDERRLCEIMYGTRDPSKTTIWTANADAQGKALGYMNTDSYKGLGPVYGAQWRNFDGKGIDQINMLIEQLISDPYSRRHILSAWNPADIKRMALPPCHLMAQFNVDYGHLDCHMYQRSADMFLGMPFNIASYALLTYIMASLVDMKPGKLVISVGDAHIYVNHLEAVQTQLRRDPLNGPTLKIPKFKSLNDVLNSNIDDFILENYNHHEKLTGQMAV